MLLIARVGFYPRDMLVLVGLVSPKEDKPIPLFRLKSKKSTHADLYHQEFVQDFLYWARQKHKLSEEIPPGQCKHICSNVFQSGATEFPHSFNSNQRNALTQSVSRADLCSYDPLKSLKTHTVSH